MSSPRSRALAPDRLRQIAVALTVVLSSTLVVLPWAAGEATTEIHEATATIDPASIPGPGNPVGPTNSSALKDVSSFQAFSSGTHVVEDVRLLQGMVVHGAQTHVTLRNCVVLNPGSFWTIRVYDGGTLVMEDCQIGSETGNAGERGVGGDNVTLRRVKIVGHEDGIKAGSNSLYEQVWVTQMRSPNGRYDPHPDGIQSDGGQTNWVLRNSRIEPELAKGRYDTTSAVIIKADSGPISNVLLENNIFGGGQYTVYVRRGNQHPMPTKVTVRNNAFTQDHRYGILSEDSPGVAWEDNFWADTAQCISKTRAVVTCSKSSPPTTTTTTTLPPTTTTTTTLPPTTTTTTLPPTTTTTTLPPTTTTTTTTTTLPPTTSTTVPPTNSPPLAIPGPGKPVGPTNAAAIRNVTSAHTITSGTHVIEDVGYLRGVTISGASTHVTLRNCIVINPGSFWTVRVQGGATLVMEDCEIGSATGDAGERAVAGDNVTLRRVKITGHEIGIKAGSNSVYDQVWISELRPPDSKRNVGTHGIFSDGLGNWRLQNSRVDPTVERDRYPVAAAVLIKADTAPISNVLLENNVLNGGQYTVYARAGERYPAPTNVVLRNNGFGREHRYGLLSEDKPGVSWIDNYREDTGQCLAKDRSTVKCSTPPGATGSFSGLVAELLAWTS